MDTKKILGTLLCVILLASCASTNHGRQVSAGMFFGDDSASFAEVQSDFRSWLEGQGFRETPSPGGLSEWAGSKVEGQRSTWFIIEEPGEASFRIYVNEGYNQISVGFNTHLIGTLPQYERLEDRVEEFHGKVVDWFQDRPERNQFSDAQLMESLELWHAESGRDGLPD